MLLRVSLSSPGMVGCMNAASGKRKHLHSAETKSHIYNTLVAWFLSLVSGQWLLSPNTGNSLSCVTLSLLVTCLCLSGWPRQMSR